MWQLSGEKIRRIEDRVKPGDGTPVFTVEGQYTARGWTEWTQGFQFGSALLQFDATGDTDFLEFGRRGTVERMAGHVTHMGVHDHGFNNVSTYGALLRLMYEQRIEFNAWEKHFYELALKCSGAVQAARWTRTHDGGGFIYSFNGPHSLFSDTVRSLRALAMAHALGHTLDGEHDERHNLMGRLIQHAEATARYNVYYGEGRDGYDVPGRVVHESIFNTNDGHYRCPSTQQGYTPFATWTRGLAWVIAGYPEELEFLATRTDDELDAFGGREAIRERWERTARAACDFYIRETPTDGVPYWDTGAPGLVHLGDYLSRPADPFNEHEPVDSSAAAIAAQGLLRFGRYLTQRGDADGERYTQAGLRTLHTLLDEPYLSTDPAHEGLLLHAVYHWPNRWDHVPAGGSVARGESAMWGDYHLREASLLAGRLADGSQPYYTFFHGTAFPQENLRMAL